MGLLDGKTVAADVASGWLSEVHPAGFEVGQVGSAVEPEAPHLGLALLGRAEGCALVLPDRGRHGGQLLLERSFRRSTGGRGVDGEAPYPHHQGVGAPMAGNPPLGRL